MSVLAFDGSAPMTSPRSLRACHALGISQQEELLNKAVGDFLDAKEAKLNRELAMELARMELQNYEKIRDSLLEQIRQKRAVYIHLDESGSPTSKPAPAAGAGDGASAGGGEDSALVKDLSKRQQKIVDAERERLEKLKARQFSELQRAIELENMQAMAQQQHLEQMRMDREREREAQFEVARRQKRQAAARAAREAKKQAELKAERALVREQTKEQFAAEKRAHDEQLRIQREQQREKRAAQEQMTLRRERERQEVQERLERERKQRVARLKDMQDAADKRQRKLVQAKKLEAAKHKKAVERARVRQEKALQRDKEIQAMKVKKFYDKQARNMERKAELKKIQKEEVAAQKELLRQKELGRERAYERAEQRREEFVESIHHRNAAKRDYMEMENKAREMELKKQKLLSKMKKREMEMAIQRQARKHEFRNEEIAEKIAVEEVRSQRLKHVQYQMLQTRRKTAIELHKVKSHMKRQMEQMAISNKFTTVKAGAVSDGGGGDGGPSTRGKPADPRAVRRARMSNAGRQILSH